MWPGRRRRCLVICRVSFNSCWVSRTICGLPHSITWLVSRVIGVEKIEVEVTADGKPFRRKKIFNFMIRYLCPVFAAIILVSSVANALGWISM